MLVNTGIQANISIPNAHAFSFVDGNLYAFAHFPFGKLHTSAMHYTWDLSSYHITYSNHALDLILSLNIPKTQDLAQQILK